MKVLAINRLPGEPVEDPLSVDIIPDSAIIKDGRPFFVPDLSPHWSFQVSLAFRVCRLGKQIARKFAFRYFDAFAIALRAMPSDIYGQLHARHLSTGLATAFDGALILGDWIPYAAPPQKFSLDINGTTCALTHDQISLEALTESLSRFCTFKTGDLLLPCVLPDSADLAVGTSISGAVNGNGTLRFNVR